MRILLAAALLATPALAHADDRDAGGTNPPTADGAAAAAPREGDGAGCKPLVTIVARTHRPC